MWRLTILGAGCLGLLAAVTGCPADADPPVLQSDALRQPAPVTGEGTFIHRPSDTAFPSEIEGFSRVRILRYDRQGNDFSVGYNRDTSIAATVYVYPTPDALGETPPWEQASDPARLARDHFDRVKDEITSAHADAALVDEGHRTLTRPDGSDRDLFYASYRLVARPGTLSASHLWIEADRWFIKWRITSRGLDAEELADAVEPLLAQLPAAAPPEADAD